MRSGRDAGTAIHTPVPFGIAGIMASISTAVKTSAGGADTDKKRRRVDCPAPHQARYLGGLVPRVQVLIRETPATSAAKSARLGSA
jgi:hypothetical protein